MKTRPFILVEPGAVGKLGAYLADHGLRSLALVADTNTYAALGSRVEATLRSAGFDVQVILLNGLEVIVDEQQVVDVLLRKDSRDRAFLAVGSGTVTDIVRFVTLQTGGAFISVPTAPSVDGYTSPVTPMVIRRLKITAPGHLPQAIFADLDVLRAAPPPMIGAGAGDVLAKWTSTADWKLGALLWGERFDEAIAGRFDRALKRVVDGADEIGAASEGGIRALMESLIECGLCMADYGNSMPASGSEHLLSHFWESRLLVENRRALLHGAKVGVGTALAAGFWEKLRGLSHADAAQRLGASRLPDRDQEIARIQTGWAFAVAQVQEAQSRFLAMDVTGYEDLKKAILTHWDRIQSIAAEVPSPKTVVGVLRKVRGPTVIQELPLEERDLADGLEYAYYLRDRLPMLRLRRMLSL